MIKSMSLKNFKAFQHLENLEFKPLTILMGKNSCGKSSIIQSLLLLKQALMDKESQDPLSLDGFYLHYSDLSELVYGIPSNIEAKVTFSFSYQSGIDGKKTDQLEFTIGNWVTSSGDVPKLQVKHFHWKNDSTKSMIISDYALDNHENGELCKQIETRILNIFDKKIDMANAKVVFDKMFPFALTISANTNAATDIDIPRETFHCPLSFLDREVYDSIEKLQQSLKDIKYLGPIRAYPLRAYINYARPSTDLLEDGSNVAYVYHLNREKSFYWKGRRRPIIEILDECLNNLDLSQKVSIQRIDQMVYRILMQIPGGNRQVSIADVGFGYSQLLPIIIRCIISKKQTLNIFEQPEIHLHPACQANLADLFIDTINSDKHVLVETHSVDMINRVRLRVIENPELVNKIAVYFIDLEMTNGEYSAQARKLTINENGNFDSWPDGFCDESEKIARAIIKKRVECKHKK